MAVVDRAEYLDVFVAFFGLFEHSRVIEPDNHSRDVISRSSIHRLQQYLLSSLSIPGLLILMGLESLFHQLYNFSVVKLVPNSIRAHNYKIVAVDVKTCDFRFVDDYF